MGYTTKSGDTWDTIAREVYGSEYYADHLMAETQGHIGTFFFLAGVLLSPPPLPDAKSGHLPPWKFEAEAD